MTTPDDFQDKFNDFASELLSEHAMKIRKDYIGMAAWVLKQRLHMQQVEKGVAQEGETLDFWLKSTDQPVETDGIAAQPTMSFVVEGPPEAEGIPRLRIHVPVPTGFRSDEVSDIDILPLPQAIFPERLLRRANSLQVLGRYAVTNADCRVYPVEYANADAGPNLWVPQRTFQRVDTHLPAVTQMIEDLVNWNLIPQSRVVVGQGDVAAM